MFPAIPVSRKRWSFFWTALLIIVLELGAGAGRTLAQRALGTDVSGYQPTINWTTVKNAGVAFAWSKATERTDYTNPYFTAQEAGAKSVGIYIGAYHFARPSDNPNITGANSAVSEADHFWSVAGPYIKNGGSYLVPMLDWEDDHATNGHNGLTFTTAGMSAWVNKWCNTVSNYARANGVYGLRPVVYTGTWYSNPANGYAGLDSSVTIWPAWIAAYPYCDASHHCGTPNPQVGGPSSSYPWSTWNIWQYGNTNWSGGDSDVSSGTLASFLQTFEIGLNAPSITTSPTNLTLALGSNATFSVRAFGPAPLTFRWYFNGTFIPAATSSNYTITSVQLTNAGGYSVTVSNSYGSLSSSTVFLSVLSQLTNAPGCIIGPANMVNWWPADGNPNDIFNYSNATPYNGLSYTTGKQGLAFHFDGLTSYLRTSGASPPPPWTVCMWVNRTNAPGTSAALMSDGNYALKLEQYNGTRQVGLTQFGVADRSFGYVVPAGVWTHLAFVGTSTSTTLYANGVLQMTLANTNAIPLPRGYIGVAYVANGSVFADYMLGNLDEILVFNRVLSGAEISAIYTAGSAGLVRAPEFTGTAPLGNGQFRLNLRGQTGKNITLYTSPDLAVWTRLGALANPTGSTQFTDTTATNAQTFYRATQP